MATVRKRKWMHNGKQAEAWVVNYTDQGGKRRQKSYDLKRDAEAFRVQTESEIVRGIHVPESTSKTVADAVDEWLAHTEAQHRRGDIAGATSVGRKNRVQHIERRFGHRIVSGLTTEDFQTLLDDLRDGGTYGANSVRGLNSICCLFLDFCIKRRWVRRNVLKDEPAALPTGRRRTEIPTMSHINSVIEAAKVLGARESVHVHVSRRLSVNLGIFCGLRPGEVFGLQWPDVDLDRGQLLIRHSQSKYDGLKSPKTEAGVRKVPLTGPAIEAIEACARYAAYQEMSKEPGRRGGMTKGIQYERARRFWQTQLPIPDDLLQSVKVGYVLAGVNGDPMHSGSNTAAWHAFLRKAGLVEDGARRGPFSRHALRHAAASLMIQGGMPSFNLKEVIGHRSVSTTMDIYGHLFDEDGRTRDVMKGIAAALDATTTRQTPAIVCS